MAHYLSRDELLQAHRTAYELFGGGYGIADEDAIDSCLNQPKQQFSGQDLYPDLGDKAAAYAFFLCQNHAFVDGNKRTAAIAVNVFLSLNGYQFSPPAGEIKEKFETLAAGQLSRDELTDWIKHNIVSLFY